MFRHCLPLLNPDDIYALEALDLRNMVFEPGENELCAVAAGDCPFPDGVNIGQSQFRPASN
jgi:hypothetical protein